MATSTDGSSEKLPNEEGSCSLLVNNLPSQWFNSDEISKVCFVIDQSLSRTLVVN